MSRGRVKRKSIEKQEGEPKEKKQAVANQDLYTEDFLLKTIRAEEFGNVLSQFGLNTKSWRFMAYALTNPLEVAPDKKYMYRHRLRAKSKHEGFKYTIKGVKKTNEPLWTPDEKKGLSKQTSLTFVSPTDNYFPAPADIDKNGVRVGIGISPQLVKLQRIALHDMNSFFRFFIHSKPQDAEAIGKQYASDLKQVAQMKAQQRAHNEVMARIRFDIDEKNYCQILVEQNNLSSRLMGQIRARDLTRRLRQQYLERGQPFPENYTVPIGFYYIDGGVTTYKSYPIKEQKDDIGDAIKTNDEQIKVLTLFIQLDENDFKMNLMESKAVFYNPYVLKMLIHEASSMTWETAFLFYKNFFLPNQALILQQMTTSNEMSVLVNLFNCVPLEERQKLLVTGFCDSPERCSYYLFSLMNLDCAEHDSRELMQLLTNEDWSFNPKIRGPNNSSLLEYAVHHFLFDIAEQLVKRGVEPNYSLDFLGKVAQEAINLGDFQALAALMKHFSLRGQAVYNKFYLRGAESRVEVHLSVIHEKHRGIITTLLAMDPLIEAVRKKDSEIIKYLLQAKIHPDVKSGAENETALFVAAERGQEEIVKLLLDANATPNFGDQTALMKPAYSGHLEILNTLLEAKANPNLANIYGTTPLMFATQRRHPKLVKRLIEAKANLSVRFVDGASLLIIAAQSRNLETVKLLLDAKSDPNVLHAEDGGTALMSAAMEKSPKIANVLLEAKADPNIVRSSDGVTSLMLAAEEGCVEMIKDLLESKANPNLITKSTGATALSAAIRAGDQEVIKILLEAKAIPEIAPVDRSAELLVAIREGDSREVKSLLAAKANPDLIGPEGDTPLMSIARLDNRLICDYLLEAKAEPNIASKDGRSALTVAAGNGHVEIVKKLLEAKGCPNQQSVDGTPLMIALKSSKRKIVDSLLMAKADPNIKGSDGSSALVWAIKAERPIRIIKRLLTANADPQALIVARKRGDDKITNAIETFISPAPARKP